MARTTAEQSQANIQGLISQGYTQQQIGAFDYGERLNPTEIQKFIQQTGPSAGQQAKQGLQDVASQQYAFDPQQFLPGIQQQAQGVFAPQQAQLEAIRQLQSAQAKEATLTTEEQFSKQLQSEVESINRRGAFFSGGAVEREAELGDLKLRALNQLGLQAQAADFNNLAQQGLLQAEESQFIQDRLFNAESGAYSRWTDQRNFSYQAALQEYNVYQDERDFARNVFESDRTFQQSQELMDMKQKQFEQTYKITSEEFEQAKEEFNIDIKMKGLSYAKAMDNLNKNHNNDDYAPGISDARKAYLAKESGGSIAEDKVVATDDDTFINDLLTLSLPQPTFNTETQTFE
jgi:hypothetical protein